MMADRTADPIGMRPFTESLPMALLQARETTMRLFRPLLAEHGLTEQQWRVLRALAGSESELLVGDLAERTFLLGPSLSRILTRLEDRGLATRQRVSHDQRAAAITLTPAGRELVRQIAPASEQTYSAIEDDFGRGRLSALLSELHALAAMDVNTDHGDHA